MAHATLGLVWRHYSDVAKGFHSFYQGVDTWGKDAVVVANKDINHMCETSRKAGTGTVQATLL
jgi:hypothetical protein